MKFKTSKREISKYYDQIISIGYCDAQHLLKNVNPIAYSVRAEGWACDYYDIDGVLISTGYAPLKARNTKSTREIERKYDELARAILNDYSVKYDQQKEKINALLKEYINEVASNG